MLCKIPCGKCWAALRQANLGYSNLRLSHGELKTKNQKRVSESIVQIIWTCRSFDFFSCFSRSNFSGCTGTFRAARERVRLSPERPVVSLERPVFPGLKCWTWSAGHPLGPQHSSYAYCRDENALILVLHFSFSIRFFSRIALVFGPIWNIDFQKVMIAFVGA